MQLCPVVETESDTASLTPFRYLCVACGDFRQMLIEPLAWVCPNCSARRLPAGADQPEKPAFHLD
jgi:DNA-directed RNA polymerase subunit RPC12/RpoP